MAVLVVEIAGVALEPRALAAPQAIAFLTAAFSAALYSDRRVLVPALLVVSAGVAVAAYPIAQVALTNVLKHAGGAPSKEVVRWADTTLELEIIDDGPPHDGAQRDTLVGRGLAGMCERATMYGGTLDAGPGIDRGYVVRAHLPLEPSGA